MQLDQKQFSSSCLKLKNCQGHLICILKLVVKVKGKIEQYSCYAEGDLINYVIFFNTPKSYGNQGVG